MQKQRKIVAIVLVILFALITLFANLFVVENVQHDCVGETCAICQVMETCREILDNVKPSLGQAATAFVWVAVLALLLPQLIIRGQKTLITLKDKLTQ
jgi:hypothetical protein